MDHDVRLEHVSRRPLAVVRRRASPAELPHVVPEACGLVWQVVRSRGIPGAGRLVALYHDDQINLEVGVELDSPLAEDVEVVASATPAGEVATATHFGPYNRLHEAHRAVHDWCAHHGREPAGPSWEIYGHWVDAWNTDPSLIRTDVFYLLNPVVSSPSDS